MVMTRRKLLNAVTRLGGAAAVYETLAAWQFLKPPPALAAMPPLPAGAGAGKRVAILGAGVSGLCAAYEFDRAGYDCVILEASRRAGGRSLTLRRGDRFRELGGPIQECRFVPGLWPNAGPGRIPHHHVHVTDYCRQFGVALQPYIFASRANLVHSGQLDNGRTMQVRRALYDLQGHVAELLDKCVVRPDMDLPIPKSELETFRDMLAKFGDLTKVERDGKTSYIYRNISGHAGYAVPPGLANEPGRPIGPMALDEILRSRVWDDFIFRENDFSWQTSLLEPAGGMDNFFKGFLRQPSRGDRGGVFGLRGQLATNILNVPLDKVRVLTGNVGGSFGMKGSVFPEYVCLFHAARTFGRPMKWTDERSESFLSDTHGRDQDVDGELALDAEGRFLAVRITGYANSGAYLSYVGPLPQTLNIAKNIVSVYRTPLLEVSITCAFTNTTAVGAYRGAGRPEANYFMERLIEAAARETGIDRLELRRRNHIQPNQIPYATPSGTTYDSGDFPALFEEAIAVSDWDGFARRKEDSRKRGKLRGRGISNFLEVTAPPSKEMGGIRFEADGTVTIITGTLDYGQGHATPFAQVLTDRLGIPFERIRLLQGDSSELLVGGGTGGSKSIISSGTAIVAASETVIARGKEAAAFILEAAAADIEFIAGQFVIAGTDRGIGIMELADRLRSHGKLPDGVPRSLDVKQVHDGVASTFPNGCHIAEVEVDPDTGVVAVVGYTMVNDFGTVINPTIVAGQLHGGIVQGIGQALFERTVYNEDGQFLTGSFTDYALPRAADVPNFEFFSHPSPATTNPLGVKGCGEAGCAGSFPSVMNALVDALAELGVRHIDMPATPDRVWQTIQEAKRNGSATA